MHPQTITPALSIGKACFVRVAFRARYGVAVGIMTALVAFGALEASTITAVDGKALGLRVGIASALRAMSLLPLILPLVAGDLLANDLHSGYLTLQKTRGASQEQVVWGHLLSHAAIAALSATVAAVAAILVGYAVLPSSGGADPVRTFPFAASLLVTSPWLHVALMTSLYAFAGFALLTVSTAIGAWSRNGLAASLGGPLFVLAAGIVLPAQAQAVNPLERMMFANTWDAPWATADGVALYWVTAVCIATLFTLAGLKRQEVWA